MTYYISGTGSNEQSDTSLYPMNAADHVFLSFEIKSCLLLNGGVESVSSARSSIPPLSRNCILVY